MDQAELYERMATHPRAGRDYSPALIARDNFVISDLLRRRGPSSIKIAELSVGDGRMSLSMLKRLPSAHLTCMDVSEKRLSQLRQEIVADPSLQNMDVEFVTCNFDTNFSILPNETFDAVVALDVMEHVFDVFNFVSHCRRILRPNGVFYLRVPNIAYLKHRLALLAGALPVTASWFGPLNDLTAWRNVHGWDGGHLHLFTIPILRKLLAESGFRVVSCSDPGTRMAALRGVWPELLFANPLLVSEK